MTFKKNLSHMVFKKLVLFSMIGLTYTFEIKQNTLLYSCKCIPLNIRYEFLNEKQLFLLQNMDQNIKGS